MSQLNREARRFPPRASLLQKKRTAQMGGAFLLQGFPFKTMGYLRAILLRTAWMVLFWFDQPMPPHQMPSTKQAMHRGTKTYLPKGINHFMMGLSEPS